MADVIDGGEASSSSRSRFGLVLVFEGNAGVLRGRAREWLGQERWAEQRQRQALGRSRQGGGVARRLAAEWTFL